MPPFSPRASIVVRGGGELASAAARLLHLCGFPVIVLERERPLAVRRLVCFAEAVVSQEVRVEGVLGRLEPVPSWRAGFVPVAVDPEARCLAGLGARVLVDGRMAKRNLGTRLQDAPVVVGLGPGFTASRDVHAVVETQRGPDLGRVIRAGAAQADTAVPSAVAGLGEERVLRSPAAGRFHGRVRIGDVVERGAVVGDVAGVPVLAGTAGLVRGLIADDASVVAGLKVGDVDPRGRAVDPARVSDKARAVAAGVLEAVVTLLDGGP